MRVLMTIAFLFFVAVQHLGESGNGGVYASKAERRLLHKLLDGYTNLERPARNEVDVMNVSIGLDFQQIIDVDEKNQMVTTSLWVKLHWTDHNLVWEPSEFDNITDVRIHSDILWRPDVLLYNSADAEFSRIYKSNVVVTHDGSCTFIPPGIFKSTCPIKIAHFPFDEQQCKLKFGSWTYSALKLNLTIDPEYNEQPSSSSYVQNGEWDLIGIPAKWNVFHYDCCPEPYVDVTFTIHIRRRCLFYILNLVLPCALISSMTLLGFTLPPDSGEKLTLAVTILLSLTVFLLVIADSMPATSDAIPLIGLYFSLIMVMTSLSVVLTVIVLNFHHRTPNTHKFPDGWIRTILLEWLPFVLMLKRQEFSLRESERGKSSKQLSCSGCCAWIGTRSIDEEENFQEKVQRAPVANIKNMSTTVSADSFVVNDSTYGVGENYTTLAHHRSLPTSTSSIDYSSDEQTAMLYERIVHNNNADQLHHNGGLDYQHSNGIQPTSSSQHTFDTTLVTGGGNVPYVSCAVPPPAARPHQPLPPAHTGTNGCTRSTKHCVEQNAIHHGEYTCARHLASKQNRMRHSVSCCSGNRLLAISCKESETHRTYPATALPLTNVEVQIRAMSQELRFIADRMRREDEYDQVCNDWRFAAMVLDRLFLWLMVIFTISFTAGVMLSAPNIRLV